MSDKHTFELEVELESRDDIVMVSVEVDYEWQNDGIGAYEYWGSKQYDRGTDYVVILDSKYDRSNFTVEEQAVIDAEIESNVRNWEDELTDNGKECYVDDCGDDFDDCVGDDEMRY